MIVMFEVKFVCEVELFYVLVVMVIDYDCWCEGEDYVDVVIVVVWLGSNVVIVWVLVFELVKFLFVECVVLFIDINFDFVLIIVFDVCDKVLLVKLGVVVGWVLK